MQTDSARREPRCRVCCHEGVRVAVNDLLDWHGAPIILGNGRSRKVTLADIHRSLAPLNEGRGQRDKITYDSLWVHAKRHYEIDAVVAYWRSRMMKDFTDALLAGPTARL